MADLEFGLCWLLAVLSTACRTPGDDPPNRPRPGHSPAAGRLPLDLAPTDGVHCRSGRFPAAP
jgi:hypothetical protein